MTWPHPMAVSPQEENRHLERENLRLKRAVEELSILNELARDIGASHDSQGILEKIMRRSLHAVRAQQGVIVLVQEQDESPTRTLVRASFTSNKHPRYQLRDSLLGWMFLNKKPLLINDPKNDPRFTGEVWDESISSILCAPLMIKSKLSGILTVYNKKSKESFTEEDQRMLAILASQSAQIVENARLYEEEKKLLLINEQVRLAARIQQQLLPERSPGIPGYDVAGKGIPARAVGGDYYDFIQMDDNHWAICLGDVSGKGLPSAL